MDRHQDPQLASADRADDEKTILADPLGKETQDIEAGTTPPSPEPVPAHSDDDFPDGGLKAWSVVIGVSSMSRRLLVEVYILTPL